MARVIQSGQILTIADLEPNTLVRFKDNESDFLIISRFSEHLKPSEENHYPVVDLYNGSLSYVFGDSREGKHFTVTGVLVGD